MRRHPTNKMGRILAITKLTLKAAFRYRLIWMLGGLLLIAVGVLPIFLKDVGRPQDLAQLLLTYTLSATLWKSTSFFLRNPKSRGFRHADEVQAVCARDK